MKKILWAVCVLITILVSVITAQNTQEKIEIEKHPIIGSWNRRGFYYVFDEKGIMKAVKVIGNPIGYHQYEYSMFKMGVNDFIEYGKKDKGKKLLYILLTDDVSDSTTIIAFGTPFVKADSSEGMIGTWKHVSGITAKTWTIEADVVHYTEAVYDINTGSTKIIDSRSGIYRREQTQMSVDTKVLSGGRYHIRFKDGMEATILPVVYNELMYLFDLSTAKTKFVRVDPDSVPSYRDYKAEQEKRKALKKK